MVKDGLQLIGDLPLSHPILCKDFMNCLDYPKLFSIPSRDNLPRRISLWIFSPIRTVTFSFESTESRIKLLAINSSILKKCRENAQGITKNHNFLNKIETKYLFCQTIMKTTTLINNFEIKFIYFSIWSLLILL
jgi:hypothetical protein